MKKFIMLLAVVAVMSLFLSCSADGGKTEAEYYASLSGTAWTSGDNKIVFDKDSLNLEFYSKDSSGTYKKGELTYKVSINGSTIKLVENGITDSYAYTLSSDKLELKLNGVKQHANDISGTWTKSDS